ncbi:aminotransferase class IV family protein [Achromobacter seleniivolatilans]|uniref:Aminotransferase class IV family protein n=1 Tax=Achromobacter seleniivolatilans TaxID=3047478 RepID=A0ABY9LTX8_9BURK|nr:aminotransferase class IV family protein [Achromobacter sp. R39]WMD18187.1 aminotransferase class IV family protein [Achromobacter sp. R39]
MPAHPASFVVQRNGVPANASDLTPLAFAGYAHFTAMQVRDGQVRGLDLHLARLRSASIDMFGVALPDEQIQAYLRTAIQAGPPDMSLVATVFSPAGEFTVASANVLPQVLVRTSPPSSGPSGPLALAAIEHERMLPAVKHVGEVAKTYLLRQAAAQGFDDAAFVDRQGRLSEASIWNLAFWDGEAVVWPNARMLTGTTMGIVQRQLARMGVPQRTRAIGLPDVAALTGAVVMNSWTPGVAINRIGDTALPDAPEFLTLLHAAYLAETPSPL